MATMKRRVIYSTDAEWAQWRVQAASRNVSISELIRSSMPDWATDFAKAHEAQRQTDGFNTRPFTPVPKKGR